MPELPEAETIARGLRSALPGRSVRRVRVVREDVLVADAGRFARALRGRRFRDVGRRGKNVVLALDDASRLVVNLGMTGRLLAHAGGGRAPGAAHPALILALDDGASLTYDDARRFGRVALMPEAQWRRWSERLGPEPLGRAFTGTRFEASLARSRAPVRSFLLDQRKVAGVGNIYAIEALWRARIHPERPARSVAGAEARRLHRALRLVLRRAVEAGGTTLRDYRNAQGARGTFRPALEAYGREGDPCRRCGEAIRRRVFGGRPAFRCPRCQTP